MSSKSQEPCYTTVFQTFFGVESGTPLKSLTETVAFIV